MTCDRVRVRCAGSRLQFFFDHKDVHMAWHDHLSQPPSSSKKYVIWLGILVVSSFMISLNYWLYLFGQESAIIPMQALVAQASQVLAAEMALRIFQVYHARYALLEAGRANPRLSYQDKIGLISRTSAETFAVTCVAGIFNMLVYKDIGKSFTPAEATGLEMDVASCFLLMSLTLTLRRTVGFYRLSMATSLGDARHQDTPSD